MQLQCPCANLMIWSLKIKKNVYLKHVAWEFVLLLGSKIIPNPSCYFTSIMNKIHHGPGIALFPVKLQQLFKLTLEVP